MEQATLSIMKYLAFVTITTMYVYPFELLYMYLKEKKHEQDH